MLMALYWCFHYRTSKTSSFYYGNTEDICTAFNSFRILFCLVPAAYIIYYYTSTSEQSSRYAYIFREGNHNYLSTEPENGYSRVKSGRMQACTKWIRYSVKLPYTYVRLKRSVYNDKRTARIFYPYAGKTHKQIIVLLKLLYNREHFCLYTNNI